MIDDTFVFDGVCHVFNFDKKNAFGKPGEMFIEHLYAFHQVLNAPGEKTLQLLAYKLRDRIIAEIGPVSWLAMSVPRAGVATIVQR